MLGTFAMVFVLQVHRDYTPENQHDIGKSPFSIGNTSSNGGFSIDMLVFGGYDKPLSQTMTNQRHESNKHAEHCLCISLLTTQDH